MKQNIGQKLALYPTPATVVGTVGEEGKVNWMLVAHVGIVSHSKLLLSIHSAHHSVKAIDEKGKPDYARLKPVLFEMPTYKYLRTGDIIGDCMKMGKAYGETLK